MHSLGAVKRGQNPCGSAIEPKIEGGVGDWWGSIHVSAFLAQRAGMVCSKGCIADGRSPGGREVHGDKVPAFGCKVVDRSAERFSPLAGGTRRTTPEGDLFIPSRNLAYARSRPWQPRLDSK